MSLELNMQVFPSTSYSTWLVWVHVPLNGVCPSMTAVYPDEVHAWYLPQSGHPPEKVQVAGYSGLLVTPGSRGISCDVTVDHNWVRGLREVGQHGEPDDCLLVGVPATQTWLRKGNVDGSQQGNS